MKFYNGIINCLSLYFHTGLSRKTNIEKNLKSLEQLIEDNGHLNEKNMILKIDIEYNEWESLII